MPQHEQVPEPWVSFLKELDALVTEPVRLDCIGGFVVTMLYGLGRPTADVDVLEIAPLSAIATFASALSRTDPCLLSKTSPPLLESR